MLSVQSGGSYATRVFPATPSVVGAGKNLQPPQVALVQDEEVKSVCTIAVCVHRLRLEMDQRRLDLDDCGPGHHGASSPVGLQLTQRSP